MPYVRRDESGEIVSLYRMPPAGIGVEFLPDDDPPVVAFRTPRARPAAPALADTPSSVDTIAGLRDALNALKAALRGEAR